MKNNLDFRNDIQGLRALSVLAVIVFHYDAQLLPGGFVGVDAFLVISGYLITQILLSKKRNFQSLSYTLRQFYTSRFKRIVPAYYVMLLLVSVISAVLFTQQDFGYYHSSLKDAFLFVSNQYFASFGDYFAPGSDELPLLHTWSLAVEMQFYLLYPFAVLLLTARRLKQFIPVVGVILLAATEVMLRVNASQQESYYALYTRVPEFLAGAAIAIYGLADRVPVQRASFFWLVGLFLLIGSAFLIDGADPFPGIYSIPPVLGACLLIAAYHSPLSKWLASKPLVWIGSLSYSLYLWHWPILVWIRYYTGEQSLGINPTIVFVTMTLFMATSSYHLIEQYFSRKKRRQDSSTQGAKSSRVSAFLLYFVVAGLFFVGKETKLLNHSLVPELPTKYLRYADPEDICHGQIIGECLQGSFTSDVEILVLGDSHAAMLNHFFDYLGNELDFKAKIITASSCVTIPGFDYQRLPSWAHKACLGQIAEAEKWIPGADLIFIAGMWSYQTASNDFIKALTLFLESMNKQGKLVYVMPQIMQLHMNPLRLRRFEYLGLPPRDKQTDNSVIANTVMAGLIEPYSNTAYLELDVDNMFPHAPFFNNELIYFDEDHLNVQGAKLYGRLAKEVFNKLLPEFAI